MKKKKRAKPVDREPFSKVWTVSYTTPSILGGVVTREMIVLAENPMTAIVNACAILAAEDSGLPKLTTEAALRSVKSVVLVGPLSTLASEGI